MYNYLFYLKWSVMRGSSSLVLCHCAHLLMTYSYLVSWEWLNSPLTVVSSIPCTDLFIQVCLCIIFVFFKFTNQNFIRSWQLAWRLLSLSGAQLFLMYGKQKLYLWVESVFGHGTHAYSTCKDAVATPRPIYLCCLLLPFHVPIVPVYDFFPLYSHL